jgi:hypothetical protein
VDLLGEQLLARAGLSFDEHCGVGGGDVAHQAKELADLGLAPHHRAEALALGRATSMGSSSGTYLR